MSEHSEFSRFSAVRLEKLRFIFRVSSFGYLSAHQKGDKNLKLDKLSTIKISEIIEMTSKTIKKLSFTS